MRRIRIFGSRITRSTVAPLTMVLLISAAHSFSAAQLVANPTNTVADTRHAPSFTPPTSQQVIQNRRLRAHASPGGTTGTTSPGGWHSPYEQFLKPISDRHLARARAAAMPSLLHTPALAKTTQMSPEGIAVNFPGFQLNALVKGNDPTDSNSTWISLTADVNKDGRPDLITVQNDGVVNVLLNPGTGKFTDFDVTSRNTTAVADVVQDVYATAVDLNGDGYPDLEVTDDNNNRVYIYMNKKDGTFKDPAKHTFTFSNGANFYTNAGSVLFTDVNGDKIPDMVATLPYASFTDTGAVQTIMITQTSLGKGDGTFKKALPDQQAICNAYLFNNYGQVVAADMNNDGKTDLVYLVGGFDPSFNDTSFAAVVLGNGDGTFSSFPGSFPNSGAVVPGSSTNGYGSLAVSDVNGDGSKDILFSLGQGNLYVAFGLGNGKTENVETAATGLSASLISGPQIVNFADVNGDGVLDALAYNWGFIAIYAGKENGKFKAKPLAQFVSGEGGDQQPMPADFTGAGHVDIVDVNYVEARIGFYAGGNWSQAGAPAMAAPGESAQTFQVMAMGDFNGDGIPDVLASDYNGVPVHSSDGDDVSAAVAYAQPSQPLGINGTYPNLKVGINDGRGNFTYTTALTSAALFPIGASWVEPIAADLNNDGKADIVLSDFLGLAISLNQGNDTFSSPVQVSLGVNVPCDIAYVDVGDLNGDGFPDIVAAYPGDASCNAFTQVTPSGIFVLLNNGKGSFRSKFVEYGYGAYLPKLADMNRDGKLDLVLADINDAQQDYYLYAIPGKGNGMFNLAGAREVLENTVVTAIIPGDYDGDGKMDLVLGVETQIDANGNPIYNTTGVNLLQGNGDLTFGLAVQYDPGVYPIDGKFADFNGDGRPDLALNMTTFDGYTDIQTSSFVYMANLGGGAFGPAVQTPTPVYAPGSVFVSDVNMDGAVDVLQSGWVLDLSGVTGLYLNIGAINLDLTTSATKESEGESVTLTAAIKPSINPAEPTGTITFYEGDTGLGIVSVTGNKAKLKRNNLAVGKNSIHAVYSGDGNFNAAVSLPVVISVK